MKTTKILFWVFTGLLSLLMLLSALGHFTSYEETSEEFARLGYSTAWIYPLGIAKILGVVAILYRKVKVITLLAYLGFLVNFVLALVGHLMVSDGDYAGSVVALVLLVLSFVFYRRAFAD